MLIQLVVAVGLLLITIVNHGIAVMVLFNFSRNAIAKGGLMSAPARLTNGCLLVVGFVVAHLIEIMIWAVAYRVIGEFDSFEEATYFSAITYATIGYGDITLSEEWRLSSAIEGVNGILLFGWTTAFLFKISEILWQNRSGPQGGPLSS